MTPVPESSLRDRQIDPAALKAVPARVAYHYQVVPLEWRDGALVVAAARALEQQELDDLRILLQKEVCPVRVGGPDLEEALKKHYGVGADTLETLSGEQDGLKSDAELPEDIQVHLGDASVIKFVKQLLYEAYLSRATDIHIEPYEGELRIRRRIDGILYDTPVPASVRGFQAEIISRVKVMAALDIAEKRLPQDGRIKVRVSGADLDLRVSILPTPCGESVTLRLLTSRAFLDLPRLGFFEEDMEYLESLLDKPHGIILLTGPTGSGKTTTLYAFLSKINRSEGKIITIEDPIEYQIRGITQVQVHPKIGLTFAAGLRSMLRHDPDVMMVGEIRDLETAEIAIRVSLTGHLVFSTLHTNDSASSTTRLLDMGLEPYLAASSLECVIAQRLVRTICAACRERKPEEERGGPVFCGRGCKECSGTGFRGRTVIYEILRVDGGIRDLILQRTSADRIRKKALADGMRPLRECGWKKIHAGLTTPAEVLRVTVEEERNA